MHLTICVVMASGEYAHNIKWNYRRSNLAGSDGVSNSHSTHKALRPLGV